MSETKRSANLPLHIRELRACLGWSQAKLANKAGIPTSSISHFEAGSRMPALETLIALADAFDVSIDRIVFGASNEQ